MEKKMEEGINLLGNRVLLKKPKGGIRKTRGGILLSEDAYYDRGIRCKVVDCGDSEQLRGHEGKEVFISHLVGIGIEIKGEEYIIVKEFDVLGVVEEDTDE